MARLDIRANDYEWGFSFQTGGHSLVFESGLLDELPKRADPAPSTKVKPIPKKVARKTRRPSTGPNEL
jgi:hypothetical protein